MLSPAIIYLYCCLVASPSHTTIISLLFSKVLTLTSAVYKRLGQFDYGQPNCTTHHIKTCIYKDKYGDDCIYIGEVKEGTDDTPHGIGIQVWWDGRIQKGYWKDGELHGRGRRIFINGSYYIGEFNKGRLDGEGTYYKINGDKYTGIWDGNKGQGEISYKDGTKYKGQWDGDYAWKLKRHGVGTLYSEDGQLLIQGKWDKDKYKGKE